MIIRQNRRIIHEATGVVVPEQEEAACSRRRGRSAHDEVQKAVVVEVEEERRARCESAQRLERSATAIRLERPVTTVVVEDGRRSARRGDEQVEVPVVVVVAHGDRRGVAGRPGLRQTAGRRRVLETALSRVPEQREPPVLSDDDEVREAIAIEVPEGGVSAPPPAAAQAHRARRSEEHTSELQSLAYLVCRLLLEKK